MSMLKVVAKTISRNIGMKQITVAVFKVSTFRKEELIIKTTQIQVFMHKKTPEMQNFEIFTSQSFLLFNFLLFSYASIHFP